MHGSLDASSLLSLVSPPPASPRGVVAADPTGVLVHVRGLLTAAAAAGVAPTTLLLSALARRDRALAARARRTAEWARLLAETLDLDPMATQAAHDVALLADIGALAVVPRADNPWLEWQRRRAAHDLLQAIPSLAHLAPAVLAVSERFDGDGLPLGLHGDEIPLAARIARLVRDFDLASHGWWPGQPAGQTVDPALVHTWLRVLDREVAADVA
jgi:HD-GYP domain-containing protein (c-di-GMP phosphodiesterase class II)